MFGLLISDSYGLRARDRLGRLGVGSLPPAPGITTGAVLERFLGPEGDWDHPLDPGNIGNYDVSA